MGVVGAIIEAVIGRRVAVPRSITTRFPELETVRFRRGGIPVRVGGWALGSASVAAITLWRTVWLAPRTRFDPELLLHELRHVHQFEASRAFPLCYLWESVRRGYDSNRFEVDARAYAAARLRETADPTPSVES